MNVLVIAPHPDDEVLGCGGTIHRLAGQGHRVTVAIATRGWSPLYSPESVEQVRDEARRASDHLGVAELQFLDLPVTQLKDLPAHKINKVFVDLLEGCRPDLLLLPFPADRHEDHRQVFLAASVAARPTAGTTRPGTVACYETPSETHWHAPGVESPFDPNWFVDITDHLEAKLAGLQCYESQVSDGSAPPARLPEAVASLARWRGANVGLGAAEAFVIVRRVTTADQPT